MLTVIELFDPDTAKHCVETYLIFKEKINKKLAKKIVLRKVIIEEIEREKKDVSQKNIALDILLLERVYLACILHDIGKVEIPKFILNNQTKREKWDEIFGKMVDEESLPRWVLKELKFKEEEKPTKEEILERKKSLNINANRLVPVKKVISQEECEKLRALSFDPEKDSLMSIIDTHEKRSKKILFSKGFPIASEIAGQHHNLKKGTPFPVSVEVIQMSNITSKIVKDLLHLSDIQNAMSGKRPYQNQEGFQPIEIIHQQYKEFLAGKIHTATIYLWIKDVFDEAPSESFSQKEKDWHKEIKDFINSLEENKGIEEIFGKWLEEERTLPLAA